MTGGPGATGLPGGGERPTGPTSADKGGRLHGLMMDVPLTTRLLLDRMNAVHRQSRVVTLLEPGGQRRTARFRDVADRAARLAAALSRLGVGSGDCVGSFAWNTQAHLETYYAVMGMGAVLHTINLRLHPQQIAYTIRHAGDRVVIIDASLADVFAKLRPQLDCVEHVVVIGDRPGERAHDAVIDYDDLVGSQDGAFAWPDVDERAAASLCYTSGTTGNPKGVLYSHRSIVLHALSMSGTDVYGIANNDVVLSLVPLFHAMGWGLPFVAAITGADLVMPGRHLKPESLAGLIADERVTWSCGVPTLWMDLLQHAREREAAGHPIDLSSLHTILSGGTQVPYELMEEYSRRFGVDVIQGWGMTEIFPGGTISRVQRDTDEKRCRTRRQSAGRVSPLYELRVVDDTGEVMPSDGESVGEIEVRGPVVASGYFRPEEPTAGKLHGGWLCTGDLGSLDADGWLQITDRKKDAIKSGGEWISSLDLEAAIMAHPLVREAAVVGVPDERWGERPCAYLVADPSLAEQELRDFLRSRVASWWIPDSFVSVTALPRTSTGKFDKKALRNWTGGERN